MDFCALGFIFVSTSVFPLAFLIQFHHRKHRNFSVSSRFFINSRPFVSYITTPLLWKQFYLSHLHGSAYLLFSALISIQNCARQQCRGLYQGSAQHSTLVCALQVVPSPSARIWWHPRCKRVLRVWARTWGWAMECHHGKTENIAQHRDHKNLRQNEIETSCGDPCWGG